VCLLTTENGAAFTLKNSLLILRLKATYLFSIRVSKQERAEHKEIYPQIHHQTEICRIISTSRRFDTQIYQFQEHTEPTHTTPH
jgi:hypothetical protein